MSARYLKSKHKFFIQVENIIQKFNETFEANKLVKVELQSTISNLQAELESVKNKSDANSNNVDRLDKRLRIATSCSFIANMGYSETGTFLLDTDGIGKAGVPYEVNS